MKCLAALSTVAMVALATSPAFANRTFVSGKGNDSGVCAIAAPCRTFAYALTQTAASGEVLVLDSAGYGPLSITQAISISNPGGVEAGVAVPSGGTGITINAPGARIDLRGLTVDGHGTGGTGIDIVAAQHVNIVNGVVRNLTTAGIAVEAGQAVISNAFISNSAIGINITSQLCCSLIDQSTITDNSGSGVSISGTSTSSADKISNEIRNTTIIDNSIGIKTYLSDLLLSNVNCYGNSGEDINNNSDIYVSSTTIGTINNIDSVSTYGNNSVPSSIGGLVLQRGQQ